MPTILERYPITKTQHVTERYEVGSVLKTTKIVMTSQGHIIPVGSYCEICSVKAHEYSHDDIHYKIFIDFNIEDSKGNRSLITSCFWHHQVEDKFIFILTGNSIKNLLVGEPIPSGENPVQVCDPTLACGRLDPFKGFCSDCIWFENCKAPEKELHLSGKRK